FFFNDTATTEIYTLTIPAIVDGAMYRIDIANPYTAAENATTNGFARRFGNDQNDTLIEGVFGPIGPFFAATSDYIPGATAVTSGIAATFDAVSNFNGFVTVTFDETVIGNQGLNTSTVTSSTILVYNATDDEYVAVTAVQVTTSTLNQTTFSNNQVILTLDPTYLSVGDSLELHIAPTVQVLGDLTDTSDDRFIGDQSRVDSFPFGQFRVITGGAIL
ncbi:MAG: hypothetical protein MI724_15410, partial [Spirochaetales bacterium]|nr:hypothetical protein [Spirochaetales bacterium]